MKTKFAPGPWVADNDNWVKDSGGELLAMLKTDWRSREEIFASRDLIAAAPALLQGLKDTLDAFVRFSNQPGAPTLTDADEELCARMEDLISKATGETK